MNDPPYAASLMQVFDPTGRHFKGFAVLVRHPADGGLYGLTCAQVVGAAFGFVPDDLPKDAPRAAFQVDFPYVAGTQQIPARAVPETWRTQRTAGENFTLFQLLPAGSPPQGAAPADLGLDDADRFRHLVMFPNSVVSDGAHTDVTHPEGQLHYSGTGGWLQVNHRSSFNPLGIFGASGGPVWDEQAGAVIGIAVVPATAGERAMVWVIPGSCFREILGIGGPQGGAQAAPPSLGAPYNRRWYVARKQEEEAVLQKFRDSRPIVVLGTRESGKSWLLEHVLSVIQGENRIEGRETMPVRVRLDLCNADSLHELVVRITEEMLRKGFPARFAPDGELNCAGRALVKRLQAGPASTLGFRLRDLFAREVLPCVENNCVVLTLENVDAHCGKPFFEEFLNTFLGSWEAASTGTAPGLALVIELSTAAFLVNDWFPVLKRNPVVMTSLDHKQIADLAGQFDVVWSPDQVGWVQSWTGGHVGLITQLLALSRRDPDAKLAALTLTTLARNHLRILETDLIQAKLIQRVGVLVRDPSTRGELEKIHRLELAQLGIWTNNKWQWCCDLYAEYFSHRPY